MPRINLLPWREELRTQRRNQFFIALGGAFLIAGLVLLIANMTFNAIINHQQDRNDLLKTEIAALDKRIEEIIDLEEKKDRLLARMDIIEQLQRSRPGIVHVFEELVRTLPQGVYLKQVRQTGERLEIDGAAESNTRVSALMRNIDDSEWLADPDLEIVEVRDNNRQGGRAGQGVRSSQFTVYAKQVSPKDEAEELE